jgi:hypothetical protein
LNTITIARNPCVPPPLLPKVSEAIEEEEEDEAVVVAVSEAAAVSEAVATVEAAEAVTGTSLGLAEEPVVAEDAELNFNLEAFAILLHFRPYSLESMFGRLGLERFFLGFPLESLPEVSRIVSCSIPHTCA